MSTVFKPDSQDYTTLSPQELEKQELKFENEYLKGELSWNAKKSEIILAWADMLASHVVPQNLISHRIKTRLRKKGLSDSQVMYVSEVLSGKRPDFVNPAFDTWEARISLPDRADIFEDFDEIADNPIDFIAIEDRTNAEVYEIISRRIDRLKGIKTRATDETNGCYDYCLKRGVKLPQLDHESAKDPPESYWGQSATWKEGKIIEKQLGGMYLAQKDINQSVWKFRPTGEVDEKAAAYLKNFRENSLHHHAKFLQYYQRGIKEMQNMVSDRKNCQSLQGWFTTGFDKYDNSGSHGSGTVNAILTGQYFYKMKNGKTIVEIPVEREFTREQVGDKASKKLLEQARNIVMMNDFEQFIEMWSKNTNIEVSLQTPEEFYTKYYEKKVAQP